MRKYTLINWALCLLTFSLQLNGQSKVEPLWSYTDFENSPTSVALESGDLDGDGVEEIILGNVDVFTVLMKTEKPYVFKQFKFNCLIKRLGGFSLFDEDKDGDLEIFVVDNEGEIYRFDVEGDEIVEEIIGDTGIVQPSQLLVEDINQDGIIEFVVGVRNGFASIGALSIYSIANGILKRAKFFLIFDVADLKLADVNGDGYKDIIQSPALNNSFLVIDGMNYNIIHDVKTIRGEIEVADIDGNGSMEIINLEEDKVAIYDAKTLKLLDSFNKNIDAPKCMHIADISSEEGLEILIGGSIDKGVFCFNLLTGKLLWQTSKSPSNGGEFFDQVNYFDLDGDNVKEVVGGTKTVAFSSGKLIAFDPSNRQIEFISADFIGNARHQVFNFSGTEHQHIFLVTRELSGQSRNVIIREFEADDVNPINEVAIKKNLGNIAQFKIGNIRSKDSLEVLFIDEGKPYLFTLGGGKEVFLPVNTTLRIDNFDVDDFDQDGIDEIALLFNNGEIRTYDFKNRSFNERISPQPLFENITSLGPTYAKLDQADADKELEFIISLFDQIKIISLSDFSVQQEIKITNRRLGNFQIADPDKDGALELYSLSGSNLWVFDLATAQIENQRFFSEMSFLEPHVIVGEFLRPDENHILLVQENHLFFLDPITLFTEQEHKSTAFSNGPFYKLNNERRRGNGFSIGMEAGVSIFDIFSQPTSSIENISDSNNILLFPNPAMETIHLLPEQQKVSFVVISMGGEIMKKGKLTGNSIDISDLQPGVYYIKIQYTNKWRVSTFVKH